MKTTFVNDKILNPDIIKNNLVVCSLFLTSYELLKNSIIDRIKVFLCNKYIIKENVIEYEESDDYKEVKKLNKNIFEASLIWLLNYQVINEEEKLMIQKIRKHRNIIAHRIPNILVDDNFNIDKNLFKESKRLFDKIEKWWVINVDMTISGENFEYDNIDFEKIKPGSSLMFEWIVKCAFDMKPEN